MVPVSGESPKCPYRSRGHGPVICLCDEGLGDVEDSPDANGDRMKRGERYVLRYNSDLC